MEKKEIKKEQQLPSLQDYIKYVQSKDKKQQEVGWSHSVYCK